MLAAEGYTRIFEAGGARMELPRCSLPAWQPSARVDETHRVSTSTRNFNTASQPAPGVRWASAELAAVCALLGPHIPHPGANSLENRAPDRSAGRPISRYLNSMQDRGLRWTRAGC